MPAVNRQAWRANVFDNLRQKSAEQAEFLSDDATATVAAPKAAAPAARVRASVGRPLLGLSPAQRFLLALILFLNVTVLGCFALLVFQKIALPF
jgi:hypothetical protein